MKKEKMSNNTELISTNHTFAICAYQESPFLEACIQSLIKQTVKTNIVLATSTPNAFIQGIADKYNIPVFVNTGEKGITQDWNYAYSVADTKYVTIAHQDDTYGETYVENLLDYIKDTKHPLLFFTDYAEIRDGVIVSENKLLKIKRLMLWIMRPRLFWKSRFIRRRVLSMGSPICCPSVTYIKQNLPKVVFQHGYRASEDWQAWEKLSSLKGEFVFCNKILTFHRIHQESETSKILSDNKRVEEDYEMFCKFWPKVIAKLLVKAYSTSENSNEL